jgi:hypothetical protein
MLHFLRRHVAIGSFLLLGAIAIVAGVATSSSPAQAQPNPLLLQNQAPASCVCAPPVQVFGGSGGPQIAHCQCGALNCAAATAAGGVALQCTR